MDEQKTEKYAGDRGMRPGCRGSRVEDLAGPMNSSTSYLPD
jgi:hypothetical protein